MAIYFTTRNDLEKEDWPEGAYCLIGDFHSPRQRYCPGFIGGETKFPPGEYYAFRCSFPMADHEEGCPKEDCTRHGPIPVEERVLKPTHIDVHYSFAHGKVLRTWERNGYHDSDFYATIWDEERDGPREVEYDTTRFAGGGNATVDATDEVKEKYQAWQREQQRLRQEAYKQEVEARRLRLMEDSGMEEEPFMKLYNACRRGYIDAACQLLRTRKHNRFRSNFRKSLADQIWNWAHDPRPKFRSPLSPKQWGFLDTSHGENSNLPTGYVNMTGLAHGSFS